MDQLSELIDYVFVAVGGGGLLVGVLAVFKTISPLTKVIAVEPENSNCLGAALAAEERVILDTVGIFADGVVVRQIGALPFDIINPTWMIISLLVQMRFVQPSRIFMMNFDRL